MSPFFPLFLAFIASGALAAPVADTSISGELEGRQLGVPLGNGGLQASGLENTALNGLTLGSSHGGNGIVGLSDIVGMIPGAGSLPGLGNAGSALSGLGHLPIKREPQLLPTSLPVSVPTSLPVSIPTSLPISLPTSLPISLPTSLPISLPISLPLSLPTGLPTTTTTATPSTPSTPACDGVLLFENTCYPLTDWMPFPIPPGEPVPCYPIPPVCIPGASYANLYPGGSSDLFGRDAQEASAASKPAAAAAGGLPGVGSLPLVGSLPIVGSLMGGLSHSGNLIPRSPVANPQGLPIVGSLPVVGSLMGGLSHSGNLIPRSPVASPQGLPIVGSLPVVGSLMGGISHLPGAQSLPLGNAAAALPASLPIVGNVHQGPGNMDSGGIMLNTPVTGGSSSLNGLSSMGHGLREESNEPEVPGSVNVDERSILPGLPSLGGIAMAGIANLGSLPGVNNIVGGTVTPNHQNGADDTNTVDLQV